MCEPGLSTYVERAVERMYDAIEPDDDQGEPPLLPILNRYKSIGSTTEVDFKTTRPCYAIIKSHINQVVPDTTAWEQSRVSRHGYAPDYLVRLSRGVTLILEIKGYEDD